MSKYTFGYINKNSYFLANSSVYGINLILSPVFYYHFKEAMPVKSIAKAKKIAEGLLESKLPENNYKYYVFPTKEKMVYDIIAFDLQKFELVLKEANIRKERIKYLSFATLEFELEESAIELDDSILGAKEGIFFETLTTLINEDAKKEKIATVLLKKERLNFKIAYGQRNLQEKVLENIDNNLNYISAVVAVFAAVFLMLGVSSMLKLNDLDEEKKRLLGDMASKNSIQLKYLREEYEELNIAQQKIRDAFDEILTLKGSQGIYVHGIDFKDTKGWEVSVVAPNQKVAQDMLTAFKPEFLNQEKENSIFRFRLSL